jgi:hypothetical protein
MSINLNPNEFVRMFQVHATAELNRELDEVKWWEDRVRRGFARREHAGGYIQASKRRTRTPFVRFARRWQSKFLTEHDRECEDFEALVCGKKWTL